MTHDPERQSFWTAVTAVAGLGQVVILIVTARFVYSYLKATEKLGESTREQVSETQKLVVLGYRQLEAQIRPAIVARVQDPNGQGI